MIPPVNVVGIIPIILANVCCKVAFQSLLIFAQFFKIKNDATSS